MFKIHSNEIHISYMLTLDISNYFAKATSNLCIGFGCAAALTQKRHSLTPPLHCLLLPTTGSILTDFRHKVPTHWCTSASLRECALCQFFMCRQN